MRGASEVKRAARERKGKSLDPEVVQALLALDRAPGFWEGLQRAELWEAVLDLEPDSPLRCLDQDKLDDVILAFADLTDLKSPTDLGHSRGTARLAECVAREMRLPQADAADIRRAALLHDLGNVAVPNSILDKEGPLTEAERARADLHPYYSEEVLRRVPALGNIARLAGAHHERLDGRGYFRGLSGSQIPLGARILAVADEFQAVSQERSDRPRLGPEEAIAALRPQVGPHLDPACFEALIRQLGVSTPAAPRRRSHLPAGLSDREVQVLRLLAKGTTNRQIAEELVITPKTAEHHLEHIYNKLGVSSRAAAIFFAVENELVG
jgi:DNA-binding CsgD family transcriptional regulator